MLNFTTWQQQIAGLLQFTSTESFFATFSSGCIDYAENRIYREADFLATRITDTSAALTTNSRNFTFPTTQGTFIVVESINAISSAGTPASSGTRNPLQPVSREFIDAVYPSAVTATGTPAYYAMVDNAHCIVGPPPDGPYVMEVIGTQRPVPLSSANSSTFLTQYCPDLFVAACMIYGAGWQRDFSAQGDDPARAQSWTSQYEKLFQSVNVEALRAKYQSQAWTQQTPNPIATPPRA